MLMAGGIPLKEATRREPANVPYKQAFPGSGDVLSLPGEWLTMMSAALLAQLAQGRTRHSRDGAIRKKDSSTLALSRRVAVRRGNRAQAAVAHSALVAAWHILSTHT